MKNNNDWEKRWKYALEHGFFDEWSNILETSIPSLKKVKRFIRIELDRQREELLEEIENWTEHDRDCILSQYSAGQPTKDGYEMKYAGKWYQTRPIDKRPKCDCGLDEVLSKLKSKIE